VEIDTGSTAWILASSALVLLMTPGLAFFYGGLNRAKSVVNMMMMSFSSIGLISVLWLLYGFSIAFGTDQPLKAADANGEGGIAGLFGNVGEFLGTKDFSQDLDPVGLGLPLYVFMAFQMMFAIITVALISGGIADRAKFIGWIIFAIAWFTVVYAPVAHMVWGGGLIGGTIGALDFAGGTAVHINAGAAALALAIVLGRRIGWPQAAFKPHNVPFVALGAGLLWFGWFGFNAGSEGGVDDVTAIAFVNTQVATAAALLGWIIVEWIKNGKPTLVGASSGAVAGLVAITPACAFLSPLWSVVLGLVAGALCCLAVSLKYILKYDDSLDVFGIHFIGGWIGTIWIGLFGYNFFTDDAGEVIGGVGIFNGGGASQLVAQIVAAAIVSVWSFVAALIIGYILKAVGLFRVKEEEEIEGIDAHQHKESAYETFTPTESTSAGAHAVSSGV
jgi:Amt family ammonium transporter